MTDQPSPFRAMLGFALGFGASFALHLVGIALAMGATVAGVTALGLAAADGSMPPATQDVLGVSLGLWEWLYLGPVAWLAYKRGSFAFAWGVISGGLIGLMFAGLVLLTVAARHLPA